VSAEVPARAVLHWQPEASASHPLAAVRFTNSTAGTLQPGAVTVYSAPRSSGGAPSYGAFLGDAQLGVLPVGEERMLAYAQDQRLVVSRSTESRTDTARGRVVRGQWQAQVLRRNIHTYSLRSAADEVLDVVVDEPRQPGQELLAPTAKVLGDTATRWRLSLPASKGASTNHSVTVQQPIASSRPLRSMSLGDLEQAIPQSEDGASTTILTRLRDLRRNERDAQRERDASERAVQLIREDQDRLRKNLAELRSDLPLHREYTASLRESETRIATAMQARDARLAQAQAAEAALVAYLDSLNS
jgi:hypothetical protein